MDQYESEDNLYITVDTPTKLNVHKTFFLTSTTSY